MEVEYLRCEAEIFIERMHHEGGREERRRRDEDESEENRRQDDDEKREERAEERKLQIAIFREPYGTLKRVMFAIHKVCFQKFIAMKTLR